MRGNRRDEIQQLRQDRDRREERGGQQERDRGAGGAAGVAGGTTGGAGRAAREEVGEGKWLLSKPSLFRLRPLSAHCLDCQDASGVFLFPHPLPRVSLVLPKNFHSHGSSDEIFTLWT